MNILTTFIIVLLAIVLAVPGYVLRKIKLLPEGSNNVLAVVLLYVSQPLLIMSSLLGKTFSKSLLPDFAAVFIFAIVLQFAVYFIARVCFKPVKEESTRRICVATSYLGNVGFMGIPVIKALFPGNDTLLIYTVIFNIVFNAMSWTLAIYAITGDKSKIRPWKIILNPPTVVAVISLPFFILNVSIPENVLTTIGYLGDMTLPLSMIILGIRLADIPAKRLFTCVHAYASTGIKLIVCPLVSLGIILLVRLLIPISNGVVIALYIISAMPSASTCLNFAERFGGDTETAATSTLLSTIFCILTIPLLMLMLKVI